jgi:hypothetical protein
MHTEKITVRITQTGQTMEVVVFDKPAVREPAPSQIGLDGCPSFALVPNRGKHLYQCKK